MTASGSLTDDFRAVSRLLVFGVLAVGLVAGAGVLVFGGVLVDGGDDPVAGADDGSEIDPPADDRDESSDPPATGEDNPPESVAVEVNLWEQEIGDRLLYSSLSLRNASGAVVENKSLTGISSTTFEDLRYGENYTLSATAEQWPTKTIEFTASETYEKDVIVGYEFKSADSFGYSAYVNLTEFHSRRHETKGLYNNGEAVYYVQFLNDDGSDAAEVEYYVAPNETTYGLGSNGVDEVDHPGWGYPGDPKFDPLYLGVDEYEDRTFVKRTKITKDPNRQFLTEKTGGRNLDLYEVDISSLYSEGEGGNLYDTASVYVNPQTGYVVRIETNFTVFADSRAGSDWYRNAGQVTYEFYNFGSDIDISRDDLDRNPP